MGDTAAGAVARAAVALRGIYEKAPNLFRLGAQGAVTYSPTFAVPSAW